MINASLFSSKSDNWETPKDFFQDLNDEFHFNLDVCATFQNKKCERYYSLLQDGLTQKWDGVCWMNPPYGKTIGKWVEKAYRESMNGSTVVCLLPSRTDTKWFHDYILGKAEIRFIKGRLKFGDSKNSAPFPSMIVVFKQED